MLEANFASSILELMNVIERFHDRLFNDIASGSLSMPVRGFRLDLTPNPGRAEELREAVSLSKGGFEKCALRIWPSLRLVLSCDTGSMEIYAQRLRFFLNE